MKLPERNLKTRLRPGFFMLFLSSKDGSMPNCENAILVGDHGCGHGGWV